MGAFKEYKNLGEYRDEHKLQHFTPLSRGTVFIRKRHEDRRRPYEVFGNTFSHHRLTRAEAVRTAQEYLRDNRCRLPFGEECEIVDLAS